MNCLTPTDQFMTAHFLSFSSIACAIGSLYSGPEDNTRSCSNVLFPKQAGSLFPYFGI